MSSTYITTKSKGRVASRQSPKRTSFGLFISQGIPEGAEETTIPTRVSSPEGYLEVERQRGISHVGDSTESFPRFIVHQLADASPIPTPYGRTLYGAGINTLPNTVKSVLAYI